MDENVTPTEMAAKTSARLRSAFSQGIVTLVKLAGSTVILVTEVAFVAVIGGYAGIYLNARSIVDDCARVNLAKVGDGYINCTIVEPKKDSPLQPPR